MIVTCEKCATRFNLDESLLDADGSTVRCSRCRHTFTAFPPPAKPEPEFDDFGFQDTDFDTALEFNDSDFDIDDDLPKDVLQEVVAPDKLELETTDPGETDIEFEDAETAEAPEDNLDLPEELKLSDEPDPSEDMAEIQENLEQDTVYLEDKDPEFDPVFELDQSDDPDSSETDMEDADTSAPDASPHEPPPPRRPARASLIRPPGREDEPMPAETPHARKKAAIGRPVLVLLILFLLAGGGYIAATLTGYKIPLLPDIKIPFIDQYLPEKTQKAVVSPDPVPDQKSVTGRFITNDNAGELFIITGKIENPAQIPYRHIQVKGTLFQKEKKAAMSQMAFCGNIIPESTLKTGRIEDLTAQLKIPGGTADINEKIMPGDTVPFMLVFADLPRNLENFTVEVAGFEKAIP